MKPFFVFSQNLYTHQSSIKGDTIHNLQILFQMRIVDKKYAICLFMRPKADSDTFAGHKSYYLITSPDFWALCIK